MRIGIDAHMLGHRETGNETYILELITALAALEFSSRPEFIIFVEASGRSFLPVGLENKAGITIVELNTVSPVRRLVWEWPRLARRYRLDLLHLTYNAPLVCSCPVIVTVHDISFEKHPEWFSRRDKLVLKTLVPRSVKMAARVLVGADFTRQELLATYPQLSAAKIKVTPYAVGASFRPVEDAARLAQVREKYQTSPEFVLAVGNLQPRKNLLNLLDGFAQAVRSTNLPHKLVLAGPGGRQTGQLQEAVQQRGLSERVIFAGFVEPADLPALYSAASLFAYPSFYEGFGFPVLEAMACGTPVLTSNSTVLPEVAGEAALLINPLKPDEIGAALVRLLTEPEYAASLRAKGLAQAAGYAWTRTALETLKIYEEVYAEKVFQAKAGLGPARQIPEREPE